MQAKAQAKADCPGNQKQRAEIDTNKRQHKQNSQQGDRVLQPSRDRILQADIEAQTGQDMGFEAVAEVTGQHQDQYRQDQEANNALNGYRRIWH